MKNRIGSNQYKEKRRVLKPEAWASIWFVAFITSLTVWFVQPRIVSPCPETGCFLHTIYAKESPDKQTVRDRVLLAAIHEFGSSNAYAIDALIMQESTFNQYAVNPSSGACGLFQALPCAKMKCGLDDVDCQIKWGMKYIRQRYGNAIQAWLFHQDHNWY